MGVEAAKFNTGGMRSSKGLAVGLGMLTGGPIGAAAALAGDSPGGKILGGYNAIAGMKGPSSQVINDVNTMNKEISNPDGGIQMLGPDAMQRRLDAFTPDQLQQPSFGSSYNNAIQRRLAGPSL